MLIFNFSKGTIFVFASNDLIPIFKNVVVCFVGNVLSVHQELLQQGSCAEPLRP